MLRSMARRLRREVYRRMPTYRVKARMKRRVLDHLVALDGYRVRHGPFTGMLLDPRVWWGEFDVIGKLLGAYEEHVLAIVAEFYATHDAPFVDIGAADGYYAVGVARGGRCARVHAFEIDPRGRALLADNARRNRVPDRIAIHAAADEPAIAAIVASEGAVLAMFDIEGAEYDLLTPAMLRLLEGSTVIVELHPRKVADGFARQAALLARASALFEVTMLRRDAYRPNAYPELDEFSDDERLIAFSEGRSANGQWALLRPRSGDGATRPA